jgi:hypothetical protein
MNELSDEFIDTLLAEKPSKSAIKFDPINRQTGPVRYVDVEKRCSERGCGSPTYIKVNGITRCYAHALRECNNMLIEAGFE